MSERPFMQLYVSDFIGDTLHLSTEQVGAYLLLLMAMWNAGGSLPDDEAKLARIVRLSVKKWRAVAPDLLSFFERVDGAVRHNRLTREMQKSETKSQSRASAGARGGLAKALKDKGTPIANATDLPWHLPDTRSQKDIEPIAQHLEPVRAPDLTDRLLEAAGIRGNPNQALAFPGPILSLMDAGYDLGSDILPAIRSKPNPNARSWTYFVPQIEEFRKRRLGMKERATPDTATKLAAWPAARWRPVLEHFAATNEWNRDTYGPKPGEPGCFVPPELLTRAA